MESASPLAVPVVGMHRSGTSMVGRMLEAGGVGFGTKEELAGPGEDNRHGFWEHQGLREINEALLERRGGDWRSPPSAADLRLDDADLEDLRDRAREQLAALAVTAPLWGWKDPRTSLLLPFWLPLLPAPPLAIFCLRHPSDVAASLTRRNRLPELLSSFLWQEYAAQACHGLQGCSVLVVAYEDILQDPQGQARRIEAFLGAQGAEVDAAAMAAAVDRELAHHQVGSEGFSSPWQGGSELYADLAACAAGTLDFTAVRAQPPPRDPAFCALMADAARLAVALDVRDHAYVDRVREEEASRVAADAAKEQLARAEDGARQEQEERLRQAERVVELERELQELEHIRTRMDNLQGRLEVRLGQALRRVFRRQPG